MTTATYEDLQPETAKLIKIGEGKYREVFRVGTMAIKILKDHVKKDYFLFRVKFPIGLYTKLKFGIADFNEFEYQNYRDLTERVPEEMQEMFARIHSVGRNKKASFSISDLVLNEDSSLSRPVSEHDTIKDTGFWRKLKNVRRPFSR